MASAQAREKAILALLASGQLRWARFNPDEPRDPHGRWTDEGGFSETPSDALLNLESGRQATVSPEDARGVVEKAADQGAGPVDLTNLTIEGTPIFAGGLNRSRTTMPQIPREHQEQFLESLDAKGISVDYEQVRPGKLLPTQNEIDAVRVGQKLHAYDRGDKDLRAIMVSKDNYVLDGHHRWATMVIVDVESPKLKVKIPIIRLGAEHKKALRLMLDFTKKTGIVNRALVARYPVRQAGDSLEAKFSVAIRAAFAVARKRLPNVDATVSVLKGALERVLPALVKRGLDAGGEAAAARIKMLRAAAAGDVTITMQFNGKATRAIKWAKAHAAELVTELARVTRERLRAVVVAHQSDELTDKEFSDALEAAVGDEVRAETIARTESMTAVHRGQREAWDQAVDEGLLTGDERRTWIVTPDDRLCPICEPLDGEEADLDGEYPGGFDGPPAHPNCRCTEGLA